jgi:formamidopyrimidine-DNA glycosylase
MIELPEAITIAGHINATITGKKIVDVVAAHNPHKFAWFYGDPQEYKGRLAGKTIGQARALGCMVEIKADGATILLTDGVALRFLTKDEERPPKHQLLITFADGSALCASIQMYGGLWCFKGNEFDNPYYRVAQEKPSPLSSVFNKDYFTALISATEVQKLSAKALLATEQRIPGLGNGVLQDILFRAGIHPKKRVSTFSTADIDKTYDSVKSVLEQMTKSGGRDTEKDLFGAPGGYKTVLSKNTAGSSCPVCGNAIKKEAYMGGSIYYCSKCQRL